ncbi:MAG: hypothetical protein ACP5H2_07075, partial [Solirubrobacteraceae bacterium]
MPALQPLKTAAFRHLAGTYAINDLGNWIGEIALAILVYGRTGSALATALLFMAMRGLPALASPLVTAHVESRRARPTLTGLYSLEFALFVALAIIARHFSLLLVLALVAIGGEAASVASA